MSFLLLLGYPLVCLLLGTLSGSASWPREAAMNSLLVVLLAACFSLARRKEQWPLVGGLFEPALAALFLVLAAGTLQSPCAARSWRLLLLFAAAAGAFYLVRDYSLGRARAPGLGAFHFPLTWIVPATGTAAALWGLLAYALHWTSRVAAPLGHHNYMAGFLLLHLPLTVSAAAVASAPLRIFWLGAAAVQVLALLLTGSLAGIAVLGGLALYAGWRRARRWYLLLALFLAAAGLALLFRVAPNQVIAGLRARAAGIVSEQRDPSFSLENRLRYVSTGWAMGVARPPAGFGLGSVPLVSAAYRPQTPGLMPAGEALPQLHCAPTNLLAETGFLGLFAVLFLLPRLLASRAAAPRAALWGYLFFSLSDYQLDVPALLFPLAVIAALGVSQTGAGRGDERTEPGLLLRWLAAGALLALALAGSVLLGFSSMAHYQFARLNFARAADWDQHCGFYSFQAGVRADQQRVTERARLHYLEAARRMPDVIPVAAQTGALFARTGAYNSSLEWLERAAALDYYFTLAHFHLGRARLHTGDRAAAVEAFATSFLVQPATVLAEEWRSPPERDVYSQSLERAIDRLYELAAFYPESGPWRRWNELGAYLVGRRNRLPEGPYRVVLFEWLDRDLAVNHSLIVFRRSGIPARIAPVVLLSAAPHPQPPAGIGSFEGLPSRRAK